MSTSKPINLRSTLTIIHDIIMSMISFNLSLLLRLGDDYFDYIDFLFIATPIFGITAGILFYAMGLYRGIWHYASTQDLLLIVRAVSMLILINAVVLFMVTRLEEFPRSALLINWFTLISLLGAPRFLYRELKDNYTNWSHSKFDKTKLPILLIGAGDDAETFLRDLRRDRSIPVHPVGILTEKKNRIGFNIHGVPVLGLFSDLPQVIEQLDKVKKKPQKVILTKGDFEQDKITALIEVADRYGLSLSRLPKLTEFKKSEPGQQDIRPIDVEDLLGRPQKTLDRDIPGTLLKNKNVLITGAGGSIGSELVRQICAHKPDQVCLLEANEFALYKIDREVKTNFPDLKISTVICDIRNSQRLNKVFNAFKPDYVFHAAALKHVPLVEENPVEGILTNVFGTKNVADACVSHQVKAMVQVSTDKAVNPTNVMGATKRIAEIYTQALDLNDAINKGCNFITVRFGNVLGSTGSVVPLFQDQLNRGGPITVTHREMTRYFMTIREASELILQAFVLANNTHDLEGRICVLDMGSPIQILNLAEQMIRMAGYKPYQDIDIVFTGLRPGEKLFEEIFHGDEPPTPSSVEGLLISRPRNLDFNKVCFQLDKLFTLCGADYIDQASIYSSVRELVPEYVPK